MPANLSTSAITVAPPTPETVAGSLRGQQLALVRVVWIVIASATLALVIAAVPIRHEKVRAADPYLRGIELFDCRAEAGWGRCTRQRATGGSWR